MGRLIFLFTFILILIHGARLSAQPDFVNETKDISKTRRNHPYLLFDEAGKQTIIDRIKTVQADAELYEKIRWEGNRYLNAPMDMKIPEKNIHTRYYGVDEYRRYMNWHIEGALTLAFLYQMTGDKSYAEKAFEYADKLCYLDSWINRAHYFEIIYSRVWPYNVNDDQVVFSYDITSSQYARGLSIVYDWLYPAMTKYQRDRIRSALLERAITLVRGNYEYHWWATAYKCNWSAVCHSALGMAALALLNEDPHLTDVVARSYEGVWNLFENYGENGGWQEGRGYWSMQMEHSIFFMEALKRATSGKVNLFMHEKIRSHPCDFALFGLTAGFGDSRGEPVGNSFMINKLVAETGSASAAWYRQNFIKSDSGIFDLIWPVPNVEAKQPDAFSVHFKDIDWVAMRKNFQPENITIVCKAGMNDDPHHGHLDCGTFSLSWMGQYFIGEMKRTGYDEKYFGEMRWEYPLASSKGHNLVMVNNEEQVHSKYKDQPWRAGIGGEILGFQSTETFDYVIIDPTNAYPGVELKKWKRWIILDKENNFAIVCDKVNCAKDADIEVRFQPGVDFTVKNQQVVLHSGNSKMNMIPVGNVSTQIKTGRLPLISLRLSDTPEWHNYFSVMAKAKENDNFIGTVFIPENGESPKVELEEVGGTQQLTCRLDGKVVKYEFSENGVKRTAN
jgi:hypothetical protein